MPNRNTFDSPRDRDDDRNHDFRQQQGHSSRQMSQFDDQSSRYQDDWSTGEDYTGHGQMGGSSGAGYGDSDSGFAGRGQGQGNPFGQGSQASDHNFGAGSRYGSDRSSRGQASSYGGPESQFSRSGQRGGSYRGADYGQGSSGQSYGASSSGRNWRNDYGDNDYQNERANRYGASGLGSTYGDRQRFGPDRGTWSQDGQANRWEGSSRGSGFAGGYGSTYGSTGYGSSAYGGSGYDRSNSRSSDEYGSWREYGESRGFFAKAGDEIASWFGDEDAARRREMDHRGRGPSNYTRSDDRIQEDANERLTHDPMVDASSITVTVNQGEVTLDGTVDSRNAKRRAEDCVEDVSGVKHVQNNLRVHSIETRGASGSYGQSSSSTSSGGAASSTSHNLSSTAANTGTGNATTGVGTTAPGATGSTGSTGASNKT